MSLSIGAGFSVGAGFTYNPSITAVAGNTTTVSVNQNTAITSFNPFSSVQFGTTPYTYFVSSGTLPTGISLNTSTGLVSGTPTISQSAANVTFSVQDASNQVATTTSTVSFAVVAPSFTMQYLVVAGGGAGGAGYPAFGSPWGGAGGGAGGLVACNATITSGTSFTVTVGSGGNFGGAGNPSSLVGTGVSVTATGGGNGHNSNGGAGTPGGSGGGGTWGASGTGQGGAGTPGQGYPGGPVANQGGSGGGGAGGIILSASITTLKISTTTTTNQ